MMEDVKWVLKDLRAWLDPRTVGSARMVGWI